MVMKVKGIKTLRNNNWAVLSRLKIWENVVHHFSSSSTLSQPTTSSWCSGPLFQLPFSVGCFFLLNTFIRGICWCLSEDILMFSPCIKIFYKVTPTRATWRPQNSFKLEKGGQGRIKPIPDLWHEVASRCKFWSARPLKLVQGGRYPAISW